MIQTSKKFCFTFLIILVFLNSSYSQFLEPNKCEIVQSEIELEQNLTFCQFYTDSTREVFQVRKVILIDTDGVTRYNPKTKKLEHEMFKADTIPAYLIDGIYRSYYLTDTLKVKGILTTRPLITDEYVDTFKISVGYVKNQSNRLNWDYSSHSIEQLQLKYNFKLSELGEWGWFYDNGEIKTKGHYSIAQDISFHYSDEECKGGPRTSFGYGRRHIKDGIWKKYNRRGELIREYVVVWDDVSFKWIEVEKK